MADFKSREQEYPSPSLGRRKFVSLSSNLAMFAGLMGGYGAFAYLAARFSPPDRPQGKRTIDVTESVSGPGHDPCLTARAKRPSSGESGARKS